MTDNLIKVFHIINSEEMQIKNTFWFTWMSIRMAKTKDFIKYW